MAEKTNEETNVSVERIFYEAEEEVRKDKLDKAKKKIKSKLLELNGAERIVSNLRREVDELKLEIKQDLEG